MRWGSLFSILMMAGASTMAPRFLSQSMGMDPKAMVALLQQLQAAGSGGALDGNVPAQPQAAGSGEALDANALAQLPAGGSGMAQAVKVLAQLQALQNGRGEEVPLEQMAAIQGLANSRPAAGSPDMQRMALAMAGSYLNRKSVPEQWRAGLLQDSEQVRRFYRSHRQQALAVLVLAGLAVLAAAALGAVPLLRGLARFVLGMTFGLSGRFLILVSLAAVGYFAASRLNPWPLLPPEILAAPVSYMLISGLFLRLLDPNYPLWNTLLKSLAAPLAACLGVAGWVRFKPLLAAYLA